MPRSFLFVLIGFWLALIVVGVFVSWPQYKEFQVLQVDLDNKELELIQKEKYFASLQKSLEDLQNFPEELVKVGFALPDDPTVADVISFLRREASASGIILRKLDLKSIGLDQERTGLQKTSLVLSAAGQYQGFKNFLNEIQNSARIIRLKSFASSSLKEARGILNVDLELEFSAYPKSKIQQSSVR